MTPDAASREVEVVASEHRLQAALEALPDLQAVARIDNGVQVRNEEQGKTVWLCWNQVQSWRDAWPQIRHLG